VFLCVSAYYVYVFSYSAEGEERVVIASEYVFMCVYVCPVIMFVRIWIGVFIW
jgi:hypothetical protein